MFKGAASHHRNPRSSRAYLHCVFVVFSSLVFLVKSRPMFTKEVDEERNEKLELNSFLGFNFEGETRKEHKEEVCCDMHVIKA